MPPMPPGTPVPTRFLPAKRQQSRPNASTQPPPLLSQTPDPRFVATGTGGAGAKGESTQKQQFHATPRFSSSYAPWPSSSARPGPAALPTYSTPPIRAVGSSSTKVVVARGGVPRATQDSIVEDSSPITSPSSSPSRLRPQGVREVSPVLGSSRLRERREHARVPASFLPEPIELDSPSASSVSQSPTAARGAGEEDEGVDGYEEGEGGRGSSGNGFAFARSPKRRRLWPETASDLDIVSSQPEPDRDSLLRLSDPGGVQEGEQTDGLDVADVSSSSSDGGPEEEEEEEEEDDVDMVEDGLSQFVSDDDISSNASVDLTRGKSPFLSQPGEDDGHGLGKNRYDDDEDGTGTDFSDVDNLRHESASASSSPSAYAAQQQTRRPRTLHQVPRFKTADSARDATSPSGPPPHYHEQQRPHRAPVPPDASFLFSPQRRDAKYLPGGLAAELRDWLVEVKEQQQPPRREQQQTVVSVEAVRRGGSAMTLVCGRRRGNDAAGNNDEEGQVTTAARVVLAGQGRAAPPAGLFLGGNAPRGVVPGCAVAIAPPAWEVDLGGGGGRSGTGRWVVAWDWAVVTEDDGGVAA